MRYALSFAGLILLASGFTLGVGFTAAQDPPAPPPADAAPSEDPQPGSDSAGGEGEGAPGSGQVKATPEFQASYDKFNEKVALWKDVIKKLRSLKVRYQAADEDELPALKQEWDGLIARGESLIPELRDAAKAYYVAAPQDPETSLFLVKLIQDYMERDDYEPALELAQLLIDNECPFEQIYNFAGLAAFAVHDFDRAESYLREADKRGVLDSENGTRQLAAIADYRELWEKEQEIRKQEAAADDLPRVLLKTTKGDIVVELFENEAPATVGNFISLVKAKFYDGLTFHRVLAGFMAQGGCPQGDGGGEPGYRIKCECFQDNARMHFRGSLSMAKGDQPDTGGCQFFLTFVPTPHLNPDKDLKTGHTVFGRVIEGMEVLPKLQRRDPDPRVTGPKPEPDRILQAEVIRDRGHEYAPDKVQ